MSSTNRGLNRKGSDFFETPAYTIKSLLDAHDIKYPVLEPCAGNLAIARMLGSEKVLTYDINQNAPVDRHGDYLKMDYVPLFQTIITNPPFNIAQEIILKALEDVELSKRPCFANNKSDSTEYAWFVWQDGYKGKATIEVI